MIKQTNNYRYYIACDVCNKRFAKHYDYHNDAVTTLKKSDWTHIKNDAGEWQCQCYDCNKRNLTGIINL